jgi:hypothetical protein
LQKNRKKLLPPIHNLYHYIVRGFLNLDLPPASSRTFRLRTSKVIQAVDLQVEADMCRSSDQNSVDLTAVEAWIHLSHSHACLCSLLNAECRSCWKYRDSSLHRELQCSTFSHWSVRSCRSHVAYVLSAVSLHGLEANS